MFDFPAFIKTRVALWGIPVDSGGMDSGYVGKRRDGWREEWRDEWREGEVRSK